MAKVDDDFQLFPCFNGLPSESLEDHSFEVEALVAGSKDIGPRLIRRLGGIPGALARRELHMPDLAKPDGCKLIWALITTRNLGKSATWANGPAWQLGSQATGGSWAIGQSGSRWAVEEFFHGGFFMIVLFGLILM